jgi:nucleoside-diphosphate-sugar epimerase
LGHTGGVVNVVITGGAGMLGSRLARGLLAAGTLDAAGGGEQPITGLALFDQAPPPDDLAADERVVSVRGDLHELIARQPEDLAAADVIFHLAAAVSGECEADFDLGLRANLAATQALLAACRGFGTNPLVVFSSSIAVFGDSPDHRFPAAIEDQTLPNPQTSYGTQKVMGEYLLADYTRKGFLRGRAVRLATVSVRPGRPNAAASGFMSSIIREPLAGQRATCPVPPGTPIALSSPRRTLQGILRAAAVGDATWGSTTAMNLPALATTPRSMAEAMDRVVGYAASDLIDWTDDPVIGAIVRSWPARVETPRASALSLRPEASFDDIVREYLDDESGHAGAA